MNGRLLFALGLLLSVILLVIGNLATLPIISLIGYGIMSLMFLIVGFTMAILHHTSALTADEKNIAWDEASGELKAMTLVIGLGFLAAGIFVIFNYIV
ncbi:hypothetical protein [uncultured Ligilactobacillus sp.]|uniref:hypothetical protein n=1 Tax=uncultured Ligilactobacillus sp. TaxID=2837633 RepID=UPI00272A1B5D|nr:hypothetical protein [uncultured Ligilactobacillus sp.]